MKPANLNFVSASAGTGKTYHLVETVFAAVMDGSVRPEAVVATTFTTASANELKMRLAQKFYAAGRHDAAAQLEEGLIGTVHGICRRLLIRFAFEAGLSPQIRILDDAEAALLLDRAIDESVDETAEARLYRLGDWLGQKFPRGGGFRWRGQVRDIIAAARTNDIALASLPAMGEASWAEMAPAFRETPDTASRFKAAMQQALRDLPDEQKPQNTVNYRRLLCQTIRAMDAGTLRWSDWLRVTRARPAKHLHAIAKTVDKAAKRVAEHPDLHADLAEYLRLLFLVASQAGERFDALKRERGAADFADLEKNALDLLRGNSAAREILAEEIDLLVVDEFQDTSPIQLALFAELGNFANRVVWVGDTKQSIYGFRGADPFLIESAVEGAIPAATLNLNRRSAPGLVDLCNQLFAHPFEQRLKLDPERTEADPWRFARNPENPVLELAEISSGQKTRSGDPKALYGRQRAGLIADVVAEFLARGEAVVEKSSLTEKNPLGEERNIAPGDIAVLARENWFAGEIAGALRERGLEVFLATAGLLATPEARLALAAFRRLADSGDTLAIAEIVALENRHEPETWLQNRLEFLQNLGEDEDREGRGWGGEISPAVAALDALRANDDAALRLLSPLQLFDRACDAIALPRIIAGWGPGQARAAQRRDNLQRLREFLADYERRAAEFGLPATSNGLFGWLEQLAETGLDKRANSIGAGAIHVGTYHRAKGLEWPAVFLTGAETELKSRLFDLRVVRTKSGPVDLADPLANRELRLWINPFGRVRDLPAIAALKDSPSGKAAEAEALGEELRLLYVAFTRARDRVILFHDPAKAPHWLQNLDGPIADALTNVRTSFKIHDAAPEIPAAFHRHVLSREKAAATPETHVFVPECAEIRTERPSATLAPSQAEPVSTAKAGKPLEFGQRLDWNGQNERDMGEAMHRILAVAISNPQTPDLLEKTRAILDAFGLGEVSAAAVLAQVRRYREFVAETFQPAREVVEVPFSVVNNGGQRVIGYIDHLLETANGPVIIDHKIFPGKRKLWEQTALGYSGQLAVYRGVAGPNARTLIHLATTGVLMEVT